MSTTGKWTHRVVEWVTIATSTYVSTSGWYVLVTTQKKAVPIGNTIVKHVPMRVKEMGLYMTLWIQSIFAFRFDHKRGERIDLVDRVLLLKVLVCDSSKDGMDLCDVCQNGRA